MKKNRTKHSGARGHKLPKNAPVFHIPKKKFGQNFLVDPRIKEKIIESCDLQADETILEIGPGLGVLTTEIAKHVHKVIAVETDLNLINHLNTELKAENVEVLHADFLKLDLDTLKGPLKVIGNLPYNISTPIVERIITRADLFHTLFITIQYELGKRIVAKKGTKEYGSFSLFTQYYSDPKMLFKIKNTAFRPIPKVMSCFLKFDIATKEATRFSDEKWLFQIIQSAFQQRRKTILNTLSSFEEKTSLKETLQQANIDPKARAETLSLEDYLKLAELLEKK